MVFFIDPQCQACLKLNALFQLIEYQFLALLPADIAAKHKRFYLHNHDGQVHLAGSMERQS